MDGNDLTTAEAGRYFGVCPATVAKWIDTGVLGGCRLPGARGHRRASRSAVADLLRSLGLAVPESLLAAGRGVE